MPLLMEILPDPEIRGGHRIDVYRRVDSTPYFISRKHVFARLAPGYPVADGVHIAHPDGSAALGRLLLHSKGRTIHRTEAVAGASRFRGAHDIAALIDPHGHRNIGHVVEFGDQMMLVDQIGIGGSRRAIA